MKKLRVTIILFILSIFITSQLFSKKMVKEVKKNEAASEKKTNYTIEETTEIMRSSKLGNIKLDHDDHVYKCMKISKEGKDLEGAVQALINFKTNFGYTLDDDEVKMLIRISRVDTNLYNDIALASKKVGKKKTTVNENFTVVQEVEKGNGKHLLVGLERATMCGYKIENDYFSWKRLNLLIQVGKLENENRFMEIYNAMKSVGMGSKVNSVGLEVLYKLYHLKGDVPGKISEYLKVNKWKSRKQPGKREYQVISDLMNANYSSHTIGDEDYSKKKVNAKSKNIEVAEKPKKKAAVKKKKSYSIKKKRKKYVKPKKKVEPKQKLQNRSLKPCSPKLTKN